MVTTAESSLEIWRRLQNSPSNFWYPWNIMSWKKKKGAQIRPVKTQYRFSHQHFTSWHKLNLTHYPFTLPAYSIPVHFKIRLFARKSPVYVETQELYIFILLNEEVPNVGCPRLVVRDDGVCRASREQLFVSFPNSFINRAHLQSHKLHSIPRPFCIASFTRAQIEHLRGLL